MWWKPTSTRRFFGLREITNSAGQTGSFILKKIEIKQEYHISRTMGNVMRVELEIVFLPVVTVAVQE
jgi:hypothetical protein